MAATHPVFCCGAVDRLRDAPVKLIVVTDTIPLSAEAQQLKNIKQLSLAELLGEAIKRIHLHQSVSQLFLRKSGRRA